MSSLAADLSVSRDVGQRIARPCSGAFGRRDRVDQEHGHRHGAYPSGDWRDVGGLATNALEVDVSPSRSSGKRFSPLAGRIAWEGAAPARDAKRLVASVWTVRIVSFAIVIGEVTPFTNRVGPRPSEMALHVRAGVRCIKIGVGALAANKH
jgi:hypothetical protein